MTEPKDHVDDGYDLVEIRRDTYEMYQELEKSNKRCLRLATTLLMTTSILTGWALVNLLE